MIKSRYSITNRQGAHLMVVVATSATAARRQARKQWSGKIFVTEIDSQLARFKAGTL